MSKASILTMRFPLFCLVLGAGFFANVLAEEFPRYGLIEPNVAFWEKVFAKYGTSQGMIHDRDRLDVIYEVVDIDPARTSASQERNRELIQKRKDHYERLLKELAEGKATGEEHLRIKALFGEKADAGELREAATRLRFQMGIRDRFRDGVIRSGAYLNEMKAIFRSHGVPEDLCYLPHVESSFDPNAYSKFGAAGMWQFMRATGRMFMTVDYSVDERRDPILSTHAAARLLKRNYEKTGSWPVAITAYNHGVNGMMRAQKQHGDYPSIYANYSSRSFGFASRNFYAEFLAVRDISKNIESHFPGLQVASPVKRRQVKLQGFVPVADLSEQLGIPLIRLRELNPALREPIFAGQKYIPENYSLFVPDEMSEARLVEVASAIYREGQKRSQFHRVERGESIGLIARRYGVSQSDLIAANNLNRRATIFVGQNLHLPGEAVRDEPPLQVAQAEPEVVVPAQKSAPLPTPAQKATQTQPEPDVGLEPEVEPEPEPEPDQGPGIVAAMDPEMPHPLAPVTSAPVAAAPPSFSPEGLRMALAYSDRPAVQPPLPLPPVEHTPVSLSANTAVAQDAPVAAKGEATGAGKEIVPWIVTENLSVSDVSSVNGRRQGSILVQPEETLGHYAEWLGVRAGDIRRLNGMNYSTPIRLGRPLKIPLLKVSAEEFYARRMEYHQEISENFFATYQVTGQESYTIRSGDNLWQLCHQKFEIPFWLLQRYNPDADLTSLTPGRSLQLPVVVARDGSMELSQR